MWRGLLVAVSAAIAVGVFAQEPRLIKDLGQGFMSNPVRYFPANNVTHGEMAVFAVRTFALP